MDDEQRWLASLRPSQIRQVQAGATSWTSVELLDVESGQGAVLRDALETFGVAVHRTAVGQARHLVQALATGTRAPYVVLACHGDEGSLVLPELASELERYQPFHGRVSPSDLRSFARFDGAVVIATGCDTGHPALVRAVLDCGASAYVAPDGGPFGYASVFAPVFLFYELTEQRSLTEAVARLRQHDHELSMWRLHTWSRPLCCWHHRRMPREPMYERFAERYAAHAETGSYNALYDRPAVLGLAGPVAGLRVLDAGCGPGLYAEELADRGARVTGFDQSPALVELARRRLGDRAELRVHDLAEPLHWLPDDAFDLVVLALVLHYVDDRVAVLRELRRVLVRDGSLVVSTPHPTADWLRLGGSYFAVEPVEASLSPRHDWPVRTWRQPLTSLCAEFTAAGLVIEELLEPRPHPAMATTDPEHHAALEQAPAFIAFRLRPAPGRRPRPGIPAAPPT